MTLLNINNKSDLARLLTAYGWKANLAIGENLFSKNGMYVELFSEKYFTFGIGDIVRCDMSYSDIRVYDGNMDASSFAEYATIEANGVKIRLDK